VEESGCGIFNDCMKGDKEGEFTFTGGRGNTTIDFVLDDEEVREEIEDMRIGDRIDSNHHPVEVKVKGREWKKMIDKKGKKEGCMGRGKEEGFCSEDGEMRRKNGRRY